LARSSARIHASLISAEGWCCRASFDLHNTQVRETYLDGRKVYSHLD
jgi:hypothetical protein